MNLAQLKGLRKTWETTTNLQQEDRAKTEQEKRLNKKLSHQYGFQVFDAYDDYSAFSFTVMTELEAYKAAYKNQTLKVRVEYAPNVKRWHVTVFKNEFAKKMYLAQKQIERELEGKRA